LKQDVLIEAENLTKVYGKGESMVKALDIGKLEIRRGEFIALTGPSGCGKTTLLNLLGRLDMPTGGKIYFEGKNITGLGETALCRFRRNKVGFIFQAYHLIPALSALGNVMAPAFPLGGGYRRRALELLGLVGLTGKEGRRPGALSGGEQQRVAIARALLLDPELILADEPTGNLDTANGSGIIELIKQLNRRDKTVLVATHDRRVAEACGRNFGMVDGRIVSGG